MEQVTIMFAPGNKRLALAAQRLAATLEAAGYQARIQPPADVESYRAIPGPKLHLGVRGQDALLDAMEANDLLIYHNGVPAREGFYIATCAGDLTVISGGDDTGALYGAVELCERIQASGAIPREIAFADAPAFTLRGPAIGLQKTTIDPGRKTYEYPITPDRFPWFYDKALWLKFLDNLVDMRCNVLYIWQGHPFSSLVKVADYPEALEVTEEEYQLNREVFRWLTDEADRRGIWVVLKFYNIHIPVPFAKHHGLDALQTFPLPVTADYTRKAIAKFVEDFPHIGLMVCLGEALSGLQNQIDWFCDTILPGIKDGMATAGLTEEPPVILRGHHTDPVAVIERAKKIYDNLYTMWKYNGEGLTTWQPRGNWTKTHRKLGDLDSTHIINVHIVADLEPFRYGSPSFIQKCVQASVHRYGANGLHLYPLFYWDWPYSPDKVGEDGARLLQIDRDWMWFETWMRYAWNPQRDEVLERTYWARRLGERFGSPEAGNLLLDAYEASGECAPRILRRFGITEGNRQTMSLGMYMTQLTNAGRYMPNMDLWLSCAPQGERLDEYIRKEEEGKHIGETPADAIIEIEHYAQKALAAARAAMPYVRAAGEEFRRTLTDMEAIALMSLSYVAKVRTAMDVMRYRRDMAPDMRGDLALLHRAKEHLYQSLQLYRELAALTAETYDWANSMQTPQRRIPEPNGFIHGHWTAMLPLYEQEYTNFALHLARMEQGFFPAVAKETSRRPLRTVPYAVLTEGCELFALSSGESAYSDISKQVQSTIVELRDCQAVRISESQAAKGGAAIEIELAEDAKVLIGYFMDKSKRYLQPPTLETDTHANDRGGLEPVMRSAVKVSFSPPVNVHALDYPKGRHTLYPGSGVYMIVGAVEPDQNVVVSDAEMENEKLRALDWLFES